MGITEDYVKAMNHLMDILHRCHFYSDYTKEIESPENLKHLKPLIEYFTSKNKPNELYELGMLKYL